MDDSVKHEVAALRTTLVALIRALHVSEVMPAQLIADLLDTKALKPPGEGVDPERAAASISAARAMQTMADQLARSHPFPTRASGSTRPPKR